MNTNDLAKASMLFNKIRMLQQAVSALNVAGNSIVAMTIGRPPEEEFSLVSPAFGITVTTERIQYPPEMLNSIQRQFLIRWQELYQELINLGATDIPKPPESK